MGWRFLRATCSVGFSLLPAQRKQNLQIPIQFLQLITGSEVWNGNIFNLLPGRSQMLLHELLEKADVGVLNRGAAYMLLPFLMFPRKLLLSLDLIRCLFRDGDRALAGFCGASAVNGLRFLLKFHLGIRETLGQGHVFHEPKLTIRE